ncbi:hypothetical protein OSC52_03710 [Clostridium pasteurianum]|uniref:hypothetical protein n=1 Tax=Clostridium pasteurianum TaxID=1501 RepID=UPI0022609999|nr:hypothetical protein [Clostridium pasteurianum]UZW14961.1 hypothetical protein OSC52_03710 [Clostridium pasteurianum]
MPKFTVTLKQHTPLIHFQAEQEGATLRATELKPKLDKFLIKNVFKDDFDKYKEFLIGYPNKTEKKDFGDTFPLDYKIKIFNQINRKTENIERTKINKNGKRVSDNFPLFFANTGVKDYEKKVFVYCDTLDIEFTSLFNDKLISSIQYYFPKFLMENNFGTRQSKGFGSFFINDNNEYYYNGFKKEYDTDYINDIKRLNYMFSVYVKSNNKYDIYKDVFKKIELFYKSMRSGLDYNKVDPIIKDYFYGKRITWDKEAIKLKYKNKCTDELLKSKNVMLVKDLFGLSLKEKWKQNNNYEWIITKKHLCKDKDEERDKIERFKSPIFFKPIQISRNKYNIYFGAVPINEELLGQEFSIKNNDKDEFILKTPDKFDFHDFFQFCFEKSSYSKGIKLEREAKETKEVKSIYSDIKKNLND